MASPQKTRLRFGYKPLHKLRRHIRLLALAPGSGADPVNCDIFLANFDNPPDYEALSYAWGDPDEKANIYCNNDKELTVTKNLSLALGHLRYKNHLRLLWVDAICINQEDPEERGRQVQLMKDIYSRASRVLVWLGEAVEQDCKAFNMIRWLHPQLPLPGPGGHLDRQTSTNVIARMIEAKHGDEEGWYHLLRLFSRPWFARLWVVQEVALAKRVLVLYEHDSLSWNILDEVVPNLIASREVLRVHFGPEMRLLIRELWDCNDVINIRRDYEQLSAPALLHDAAGRKCTNPRDRIYGLLGVANSSVRQAVRPDYSAEVLSVYRNLAVHFLITEGCLNVLSCCTYETNIQYGGLWPSWICDWSRKRIDPFFTFNTTFHAAGNTIPRVSLSNDEETLCIEGRSIDVISAVSTHLGTTLLSHANSESLHLETLRSDWLHECYTLIFEKRSLSSTEFSRNALPERFLLALKAETAVNQCDRPSVDEVAAFGALLKQFMSLRYNDTADGTFDDLLMTPEQVASLHANMAFAEDRRFCTTLKARLGLTPILAIPGDVICVLNGGNIPFVLREDGDGYYRLIGEAYIHGLMDGEALEMDIKVEIFKIR